MRGEIDMHDQVLLDEFFADVCRRAEATMATTGKLEGAHYAAMRAVLEERRANVRSRATRATNSAMVPCVWHAYGQKCDVGFGCFCGSKPCRLARPQ
jgi:hypothetical protein